jgi:hypothetical protein
MTKVVHVTRKVQTDLFELVDTYGQITEDYAIKLIHDLRLLLDEEVIDRIDLLWTKPGTSQVVGAYSYKVIAAGFGLVDDRAGGIRYDPALQKSDFSVRIYNNTRWYQLTDVGREAIESEYWLSWGPGKHLDFSRGSWVSDRTYLKDGYGLGRQQFSGW